ncbi:V0/A0 complex, 116-kDa subunit of ATPase [Pholiota conissans]|uniref:V-type proton ATPase subunit a n=1 Tax=Pholiota conissans TaxID=109636 RepID=A0A9P5Z7Y6_9AGAR|nr:V0/A0 complex, 116-kDa subunit of ATPase [Pholiota conissans]
MPDEHPGLLRSEEMDLVQIFVPTEIAHDTIAGLGELGNVQFIDLNPAVNPFQRSFVGEIRRIEDMDRRLRFFNAQISKEKDAVTIRTLRDSPPLITIGPRAAQIIDELEFKLTEHEQRLVRMNASYETLSDRRQELLEAEHVLRETAVFFDKTRNVEVYMRSSFDDSVTPLLQDDQEAGQTIADELSFDIEFVTGTIERSSAPVFERVLWRILRGNLFIKQSDIQEPFVDPVNGTEVRKNVFIAFTHGDALLAKIRKVAESMGARIYPIDPNAVKRSEALLEVSSRLADVQIVLRTTDEHRHSELVKIGEDLRSWQDVVKKEKMIYETLNLFNYNVRRKTLIAEGWVPTGDISAIQLALGSAAESSGSSVAPVLHKLHTNKIPPTFFRTNKYTEGFQTLMSNYGVPAYQEINPGIFAITTFPFLFAVMFGDLGHGAIIFVAALIMIWKEKDLEKRDLDEISIQFFFGRYIILLMGLFSMYTGLMYNDVFSRGLHIWHSAWTFPEVNGTSAAVLNDNLRYPFGFDPSWHGARNALVFTNSYKMKMSIVLGVIHMTFALCLQIPNHLRFKRYSDIYTNFIPQILFLQSILGYLVWCILYKWSIDWSTVSAPPPSILNLLISMFLKPGEVDEKVRLYRGQGTVQVALLCLAGICVPWLLLSKPYFLWREMQKTRRQGYAPIGHDQDILASDVDRNAEEEGAENDMVDTQEDDGQHDFSDVVVHQVIHTIEFCLNCISHTASYLRLWALSLAHAQLSEVLWSGTIGFRPASAYDWVVFFVMAYLWVVLTIFGLCIIEGLSAFLHALRLHWVEANSKHFEGGGHAFNPLKFANQFNE